MRAAEARLPECSRASDLLIETNASCRCDGSARVDEKPVSSPLRRSRPGTKPRLGPCKSLSAARLFSQGLRVGRIQWFKSLNPGISLDHHQLTEIRRELSHLRLLGCLYLCFTHQTIFCNYHIGSTFSGLTAAIEVFCFLQECSHTSMTTT